MPDLLGVAQSIGEITVCAGLLRDESMTALLRGPAPHTLFAPSNAAFALLEPALLVRLGLDSAQRVALLRNHLVAGALVAADLMDLASLTMVSGRAHTIETALGLRLGRAYLHVADIMADNGVLHVLDAVLLS